MGAEVPVARQVCAPEKVGRGAAGQAGHGEGTCWEEGRVLPESGCCPSPAGRAPGEVPRKAWGAGRRAAALPPLS